MSKQYPTLGFDTNSRRIAELLRGVDSTREVDREEFEHAGQLRFSNSAEDLETANVYIVTVPTPIDRYKRPDLSALRAASTMVGNVISRGDVVIYESTVYPGTTEEVCIPVIEAVSGLVYNTDFYAGYSPERINPGDSTHRLPDILKVTSGSTPEVAEFVDSLYGSIIRAGGFRARVACSRS